MEETKKPTSDDVADLLRREGPRLRGLLPPKVVYAIVTVDFLDEGDTPTLTVIGTPRFAALVRASVMPHMEGAFGPHDAESVEIIPSQGGPSGGN